MKLAIKNITFIKFLKLLKRGKIAARFAAIGTAITGAVTALSGSATTGVALSAAGVTAYAVTSVPQSYEKTRHVPPRMEKTSLRQHDMEVAYKGKQKSVGKPPNTPRANEMRGAAGRPSARFTRKR
jgi:hypothetical protein